MKRKIAILGGGMGSLATAFELTSELGWQKRYEITVYNMGWRLGGKGASGRNREAADRIEEHGLHILSGCYENTFAMLRACYDELGRPAGSPLATVEDAFKPHSFFVLSEPVDGTVDDWQFNFHENDRTGLEDALRTGWGYVKLTVDWLARMFVELVSKMSMELLGLGPRPQRSKRDLLRKLLDTVLGSASDVPEVALAYLTRARKVAGSLARGRRSERAERDLVSLLRDFRGWLAGRVGDLVARPLGTAVPGGFAVRHLWILMDLGITAIIGIVKDRLLHPKQDWFKIDDLELAEWLTRHGASRTAIDSALVRVLREFLFSQGVGVAAGTALHYTLRLALSYNGAFSYKMQAGMGDAVFAPLYLVLAKRGVRFEFFHRVDRLELSADKSYVSRVHLGRQATVRRGTYDPLYEVKGLPCWPSQPLYEQLVEGNEVRAGHHNLEDWWTSWRDPVSPVCLESGRDFDTVVIGIALGALAEIAPELVAASARFREMVEHVCTTPTRAMQLWMKPDLHALGWRFAPPILGTYQPPFDTWADMSELLARESHAPGEIGSLAYFCSDLEDDEPVPPRGPHEYPVKQHERVRREAIDWLEHHARGLWPRTSDAAKGFRWSLLADAKDRKGRDRFASQYWHTPLNPSERYVLSVPGSTRYRLREHQSGFRNVVLAGDWIMTAFAAGFLEAATMGGLQAAQAISGKHRPIVGNWLPSAPGTYDRHFRPGAEPERSPMLPIEANFVPHLPYRVSGTKMYVFVLEADRERLQLLCDRQLNRGGPVRYRPLGDHCAFVCADLQSIAAADPPCWIRERDFAFWIPVVAESGEAPDRRHAFFLPFVWVDSALAVTAGRELQGFPKGMGILRMPHAPTDPASFTLDAPAVLRYGRKRTPESEWMMRPIVEAMRSDAGAWGEAGGTWRNVADLVRGVTSGIGGATLNHARAFGQILKQQRVPMVFLKQFPDAADSHRACYQAVVEAPCRLDGPIRAGGLLGGNWKVLIHSYDSCRLVDVLGLRTVEQKGTVSQLRAAGSFWLDFDFTLDVGVEIWRGR